MTATIKDGHQSEKGGGLMKRLVRPMMILPVILAGGFAFVIWFLFATQPTPQRQAPQQIKPIVEAMEVETTTEAITTTAQGVVMAANGEVELRAQVSGDIVAIHPNFTPGGYIPAEETILKIDETDYRLALADARAALNQAKAAVEIEKGQQRIAEAEFDLLEGDIEFDDASRALALRQPQLQRVEAEYEAALAAVDRAQINLKRTNLSLPYDAVVLSVNAIEGETLGAREIAGTFARADEFWVELRVRHDALARLDTRGGDGKGADVRLSFNNAQYEGEAVRIRADVSPETRLGGVIVAIDDPLSRQERYDDRPPLLIGSYVEATLDAGEIDNVIAMPRRALGDNSQVFVADAEDKLRRRTVTIAWELENEVLVRPTFEPGDRIVTSRISGIAPGTELRVRIDGEEQPAQGSGSGAGAETSASPGSSNASAGISTSGIN